MTRIFTAPKPCSRLLRQWVFGITLALLVSLLLGQVHAVKHGGPTGAHHAEPAHELHHDHDFLEQLFANHLSETDCRLFDQLADSHGMPAAAVLVLPVVMPLATVAVFQGEALARWAALFDARGPPLTF